MTLKLNDAGKNPQQTLQNIEYIRQMLGQLKLSAMAEDQQLLAYFIEMAYFEANDVVGKLKLSNIKVGKGNQTSGMAM